MARIAYVDHSYHRTDAARPSSCPSAHPRGHRVDIFWDEAWIGGAPVPWEQVAEPRRGDHVSVLLSDRRRELQITAPERRLHPDVRPVRIFLELRVRTSRDVLGAVPRQQSSELLGVGPLLADRLWDRQSPSAVLPAGSARSPPGVRRAPRLLLAPSPRSELGWNMVRALIGSTRFDSFHVHFVGDPGFPDARPPPATDLEALTITMSTWFERRSDLDEFVRRANVYFAPRLAEGIGQTFLEAMCRGQCVVAVDGPTMNEYIVHGVNGLLYDHRVPAPLDFSGVAHLGQEARRGMTAGRRRWEGAEELTRRLHPDAQLHVLRR